jgi:intracellular protein transport protein USO1
VTILLDLLNVPDFYPRLYSLQLLAAVLSARPQRTQECVLTAPVGIARLVAILDDRREAIRNGADFLHQEIDNSTHTKLIMYAP